MYSLEERKEKKRMSSMVRMISYVLGNEFSNSLFVANHADPTFRSRNIINIRSNRKCDIGCTLDRYSI
jgi:hypothetical protein